MCYNIFGMPKSRSRKKTVTRQTSSVEWLPFDSRLIPDIFSFGHVKGISKVFLTLEIIITFLVVLGTLSLVILNFFQLA
jgi:hypothetical protein